MKLPVPVVLQARMEWRGRWHLASRVLPYHLIVFVREGGGAFSVGRSSFDVGRNDLIWIPAGTPHEMRGTSERMLVLYAHLELEPDWKCSAGKLPIANPGVVQSLFRQLCLEHLGEGHRLRSSGLMLQLLGEIERGLEPGSGGLALHFRLLERIATAIVDHVHEPLDLPRWAKQARLSVSHFRRLFTAVHGMGPRAFHRKARIRRASEMIIHSGWNLSEIADKLGFSTVHNLSRAFRHEMRMSPTEFRERHPELHG
jgi:AraC family transcriptional regulator, arabinose operon regulatory protein